MRLEKVVDADSKGRHSWKPLSHAATWERDLVIGLLLGKAVDMH
jgi:hypothetical protein